MRKSNRNTETLEQKQPIVEPLYNNLKLLQIHATRFMSIIRSSEIKVPAGIYCSIGLLRGLNGSLLEFVGHEAMSCCVRRT